MIFFEDCVWEGIHVVLPTQLLNSWQKPENEIFNFQDNLNFKIELGIDLPLEKINEKVEKKSVSC